MGIRNITAGMLGILSVFGASAANASADQQPATISVVGHSSFTKAPDTAVVSADIVTNADDPKAAAAANGVIEDRVVAELARANAGADPVHTTGYRSIYVPRPEKITDPRERYGYIVTRSIEVEITPAHIDVATQALTNAGVDSINDVRTLVRDRTGLFRTLYSQAVADAQSQAQTLANAAHLRVVRLKNLDATSYTPPPPGVAFAEASLKRIPVQNSILSANVNATFEVEPQALPGYMRGPGKPVMPVK